MALVRVWKVALEQPDPVISALETHLDEAEQAAVAARVGTVRSRYVAAHGALREILGGLVGLAPDAVTISRACDHCGHATHGRPFLEHPTDVQFSLSHSEDVAVVAATRVGRVGVDVERVRPRRDLEKLARRVLNDDEHASWLELPAAEQLTAFVEVWTAREAYLKGIGLGIVRRLRELPARPPGWTITALPAGDDAQHVAVETEEPIEIDVANWTPGASATLV